MTTLNQRHLRAWLVTALVAPSGLAAQPVPIGPAVPTWQPSGVVNALLLDGSTIYVGGSFDHVGPRTGTFAAIDAVDASGITTGADVPFAVDVVVADGSGGWFLAGRNLNPSPPNAPGAVVLHILPNGQRDPAWTSPAVDPGVVDRGNVLAMAVDAGRLFIGGRFFNVNGAARWGVAALDAATGTLLPWNAQLTRGAPGGMLPEVFRLVTAANRLYVVGLFDAVGGAARNRVAILDTSTALPLGGTLAPTLTDPLIDRIAVSATRVYLQGGCRAGGGVICAYDLDLAPLPGWTFPTAYGPITASSSAVYSLETFGDPPFLRRRITRRDPETGAQLAWAAPELGGRFAVTTEPAAMEVIADRLYVGGNFTDVNGETRLRVAAVDAASGALLPWAPPVGGQVWSLAATATSVAIGGTFPSVGGAVRRNLVAIDLNTGRPGRPTPAVDLDVRALLKLGDAIVVAGARPPFSSTPDVMAFVAPSGTPIPWSLSSNGWVSSLASDQRRLFVGGYFTALSGSLHRHLASVDISTGALTSWNPSPDNWVSTLAVSGDVLFAAGEFRTLPGYGRPGVAAFAAGSGEVLSFNPGTAPDRGTVRAFAFFENRVLLAGEPDGVNRGPFRWVERNSGTTVPPIFTQPPGQTADAVAQVGRAIYAVGALPGGLLSMDAASGQTASWDSRMGLAGRVLAASASFVAVSGGLGSFGLRPISDTLTVFRAPNAGAPQRLTAEVRSFAVTLGWQGGPPPTGTAFQVEAGTAPAATDVGVFPVGAATRVTGTLGAGTYFIRVRGVGDMGPGAASSEVIVTVPSTSAPPDAPGPLSASVAGNVVTLSWGAASGNATTYVIEAGTASGLSNVGALPTGVLDTTFTTPAPAGTYFVRVRAANAFGQSAASNEVVVVVP